MIQTFHCPSCGAPLDSPKSSESVFPCPFCHSSVVIPDELRRQPRGLNTLSRIQAMNELPESSREMFEIIQLIKRGQKEQAINRFKQVFQSGHDQAVITIEAIENNQVVQLNHFKSEINQSDAIGVERIGPIAGSSMDAGRGNPAWRRRIGAIIIASMGAILLLGICAFIAVLTMAQPEGPLAELWQKVHPAEKISLVFSFGQEGLLPGQLTDPENIAVDTAGNIFVADLKTGRIQHFDAQGNFIRLWDAADGKLVVWTLEVDQNGILYAAAERNILRFDTKTGTVMDPVPNPNDFYFYDIKILSDGSIGAVVNGDTLVRMNSDGSLIWMVEDAISSIAGDTDTRGRLAVDGDNNLYLSGTFVESVFKYSAEGKFLNRWGSDGDGEGQFDYIFAVALDGQGHVVVSDASELEIFERDGRFVEQIDLPSTVFDLQFDTQGNLYTVTKPSRIDVWHIN